MTRWTFCYSCVKAKGAFADGRVHVYPLKTHWHRTERDVEGAYHDACDESNEWNSGVSFINQRCNHYEGNRLYSDNAMTYSLQFALHLVIFGNFHHKLAELAGLLHVFEETIDAV